jgi:hypothetical protein
MSQDRVGSDLIHLTQEYLAIMLGTQRTAVTRVAQILKEAGAISYSRGRIKVMDRQRLEEASCECYAVAVGFQTTIASARRDFDVVSTPALR